MTRKLSFDYRIFLEIRGCFFQHLDRENLKEEFFENLADRKFFDFRNSNRANTMSLNSILHVDPEKTLSKLSQIAVKHDKVPNKVFDNDKIKIVKKKHLEDNLEIRILNKNNSDLFITGTNSRNIAKEDKILSKTFNKHSKNKLKSAEDIKIKTLNSEINSNFLQEKAKFNHQEASLTIYNKLILDEDYLKNICRDLLKNKKNISYFKGIQDEIQPKFSKTTRNFNSMTKIASFKSSTHIDFYKNNLLKNIKLGQYSEQRKTGESHFNFNLNKIQNTEKINIKEKILENGFKKQNNLISKDEMNKINKFKVNYQNSFLE